MSKLENFIDQHREAFDEDEPSPRIWKAVEAELYPTARPVRLLNMTRTVWSAAAAVLLILVATIFLLPGKKANKAEEEMVAAPPADILNEINPVYAKEVYHFTQLIELKQQELEQMGKDQPELYRQFVKDINRLDSSYKSLRNELPANPNQEQLLEAMIQNLQLQTELLNKQLQVIKQIKLKKQNTNEDNFKNI